MVKLLSLFESISNAKSEAEVQALFEEANKAMPDNTLGHSVPVYYLNGKSGEMMVRYPDGRVENTGKIYSGYRVNQSE
jgi:hypothetical protein